MCLLFSLVWGVGCLAVVYLVQPLILKLLAPLPVPVGWVLLALFGATALADLILTAIEAAKIPKRLQALEEMGGACVGFPTALARDSPDAPWSSGKRGRRNSLHRNGMSFLGTLGSRKQEFFSSAGRDAGKIPRFSGKAQPWLRPAAEGLPSPATDGSPPPPGTPSRPLPAAAGQGEITTR